MKTAASLGIATAAGSAGQVVGPLLTAGLLTQMDWQGVFLAFAGIALTMILSIPMLGKARSPRLLSWKKAWAAC